MLGIDFAGVDHNEIDWQVLGRSGKTFALLRACYGTEPDTDFARFWPAAKSAGLVRGAYLFCRPMQDDPLAAVNSFLDLLGPLGPGDFPPTLDLERYRGEWDPQLVLQRMRQMIDAVKARVGIAPMIYTSRRVWEKELGDPQGTGFAECPLWVADWGADAFADPRCPGEWGQGNWRIHQYAGDTRDIPGVSQQADLNRFNLLRAGDAGPFAAWVNRALGVPGHRFGRETLAAVRRFQDEHGLRADGVVGPLTWSHLVWLPRP